MLLSFLTQLTMQLPLYLLWMVGIAVALTRYRNHPHVSMLLGGACAIEVIAALSSLLSRFAIPRIMAETGASYRSLSVLYTVTGIAHAGMEALAWAMVLFAVFSSRKASDQ